MQRNSLLIALWCALAIPPASIAWTRPFHLTSQRQASITNILTQAMVKQRIPGMVVAIAIAGHPIYERAFGDRAPGKPADISTIFPLGSITKQFTAACAMWLSEKHRLDLDSPVSRYVISVPHGKEITVRELLDQTSGLVDYTLQPLVQRGLISATLNDTSSTSFGGLNHLSSAQALTLIANKPLKFRPGTEFDYSNTNYLAAAMVIESVSGETYEEFLREHILVPLGLTRTEYLRTSIPVGSDVARGYAVSKNGPPAVLPEFPMDWASAAGSLASDVNDLVTWDDAFFHGRVIAPTLVRTMSTAVKSNYGYGWRIYHYKGGVVATHNGAIPGAHAMNVYFSPADMEVVVLTNMMGSQPEAIASQVLGVVIDPRQTNGQTTSP